MRFYPFIGTLTGTHGAEEVTPPKVSIEHPPSGSNKRLNRRRQVRLSGREDDDEGKWGTKVQVAPVPTHLSGVKYRTRLIGRTGRRGTTQ